MRTSGSSWSIRLRASIAAPMMAKCLVMDMAAVLLATALRAHNSRGASRRSVNPVTGYSVHTNSAVRLLYYAGRCSEISVLFLELAHVNSFAQLSSLRGWFTKYRNMRLWQPGSSHPWLTTTTTTTTELSPWSTREKYCWLRRFAEGPFFWSHGACGTGGVLLG
jgi:hypothetical protein